MNILKNSVGMEALNALIFAVDQSSVQSITGVQDCQMELDLSEQGLAPFGVLHIPPPNQAVVVPKTSAQIALAFADMEILAADLRLQRFMQSVVSFDISGNPGIVGKLDGTGGGAVTPDHDLHPLIEIAKAFQLNR